MNDPILNSIPLVAIGTDLYPCGGLGSSCLLRIDGKLVLLGVKHVTDNEKRWVMHVEYLPGRGAVNFAIGGLTYFQSINTDTRLVTIPDFFVLPLELPHLPRHQKWESVDVCTRDEPKRIFEVEDIADPDFNDIYEFAGLIDPKICHGFHKHAFYETDLVIHPNLTLKAEGRFETTFSLPGAHPGHDWFHGTSGAPITNQHGQLVALVMSGCDQDHTITGFPIKQHLGLIRSTIAAHGQGKVASGTT